LEKGVVVQTEALYAHEDEQPIVRGLWKLGKPSIYIWITSLANAIIELEAMGLFHVDI
jgi:hypothetical protein